MTRIGKNPVSIPKGVKASLSAGTLVVEGPLGKLQQPLHPAVRVAIDEAAATVPPLARARRGGGSVRCATSRSCRML